jgi:competence protein ComEC
MKRPLLAVVLLYAGGILLARYLPIPLACILPASLVLAVVALAWTRARPHLLYPLVFLTGYSNLVVHSEILSPNDLRLMFGDPDRNVKVRGILCETPKLSHYEMSGHKDGWQSRTRLEVSAVCLQHETWRPASGRLMVKSNRASTNFFAGQAVELNGEAKLPKKAPAEGTFDYRAYLSDEGIYYVLETKYEADWRAVGAPESASLADRFQGWGRTALALGMPCEDEALRLEWALTLGWRAALTQDVADPFIRAATYHIFAVDGLRMAIVSGILLALCHTLRLPRRVSGLLVLPALWFYVALTGWPASAIRATVMLTVVIVGWVLKRPSDVINSLCAAALILLTWKPQDLFQAGFQLSFLVVMCILLMMPQLQEMTKYALASDPMLPEELLPRWRRMLQWLLRFVQGLALSSFAAWVASLALVAYYFDLISPVSTPANMLAVPLCVLVLVCNLASLLLAAWFPAAAVLFNHAGWAFMVLIHLISRWFANWPMAYFYVPVPRAFTVALYYAVLLAVLTGWLFQPRLRRWKIAVLAVALMAWGLQFWQEYLVTRVTVLSFDGGDAVYAAEPGATNDLLVDCGTSNTVETLTEPFLHGQGVNRLSCLALTHGEAQEVGGAERILKQFGVKHVYASPARSRSPVYREILGGLKPVPGKLQTVVRGDSIGRWKVLHPDASDHFTRAGDNALVLLGDFNGTRILLLSDLSKDGQKALLAREAGLRADVVVSGVPTSGESLCEALLDSVQPKVIVVADSNRPVSQQEREKLRERLARRNLPVIYTRDDDSVTLKLRSTQWEVWTMKGKVFRMAKGRTT